jgi:hypothetical protein
MLITSDDLFSTPSHVVGTDVGGSGFIKVGDEVLGMLEGCCVGNKLGDADGTIVGDTVGDNVGEDDGVTVGV